ncbi:MAG: hypothetical protein AB1505_00180 [Candidatus Latescibacterota bacterium]
MPLPFDAPAQRWLHAAARAADWLEERLDGHGRLAAPLHDLGSYYKWPLFLWALGRGETARRLFAVLVEDFLTAAGDWRTGQAKSADPLYGLIADSYTNTWPIVAARVLERPEIGRRGLECLRGRRVACTGGFLTGHPGQHADRRQDIVTVAGCGNAFLAWDGVEEASGAGDCLLAVLEQRRGPAGEFRLYVDAEGRPLAGLGIPEHLERIRPDLPGQAYVYLGMAAVFLARLHAVTAEARFLAGARGYFALNQACGPAVYQGIGCCKTGWAASVLYRLTGEEEYRQSVHRAAAQILAAQQPAGDWATPERSAPLNCDVTGEMGYHLTQYCLELAGGAQQWS